MCFKPVNVFPLLYGFRQRLRFTLFHGGSCSSLLHLLTLFSSPLVASKTAGLLVSVGLSAWQSLQVKFSCQSLPNPQAFSPFMSSPFPI